jgi:tetratricopeptide (TPR) repeat protein
MVVGIVVALMMGSSPVEAGDSAKNQASQQMKWGFKAAKEGYWLEALDRFERANNLTPNQPRILNNIAVALEASGRFDEAKLAYETGLSISPNDRALRRNFSRFMEFYKVQVEAAEEDKEADEDGGPGDAAKGGSDNG